MSSLRARLLASLLGGVVLVGAAGGWVVYRNALAGADAFFDYHLRETALLLRDQPVEYLLSQQIAPADAAYDFVVQVWTLDGARVYLSRPHTELPEATTLGFSTVTTAEGRWRVYGAQALTRVVQVAQPMSVRSQRAAELALRTLAPFALLLPLLALSIWLAVGHALKPLGRLTALVKARGVRSSAPLPQTPLPEEVRPLVAALNELLERLDAARERERAFMADAAHELRTPLTALYLQLGTLARAGSDAERAAAMKELAEGVQRAIRLVEQLLALAREAPRQPPPRAPVALEPLAREIVAELVPLADARHVDLGLGAAQPLTVTADPDALRTLLRNLVDNAVRYSGEGGRVDVAVEADGAGHARLAVSDSGPGIPPAEHTRVFDRFYRRAGTGPPGSGLGLAIVKAIADAHGAVVALGSGPDGRGLRVTVTFAAQPAV
ncbi:MAG TPA: ATP-binding protein [Steroidobacteraceae bacterium]|nr:ATP-binding protein [Steroidobacteraceae bacterium]